MTYLIHIIRINQEYEGVLWFIYDRAYRRQAAATNHVAWSKLTLQFSQHVLHLKAKEARDGRWKWYLSVTHDSTECALAEEKANASVRCRTVEPLMGQHRH